MKQKKAILNKLRTSGLRPTKQRVEIAKIYLREIRLFILQLKV